MALNMSGEYILPADKQTVWARLNDPEVLKTCIPGCEEFNAEGDSYKATAKVKIGPVSTRFKGTVTLSILDPPNSYRISGQGDGGSSRLCEGGAKVRLEDADAGNTKLIYDVEAEVGGKIAQLGSRLIASVAKKTRTSSSRTSRKSSREPPESP